MSKCCDRFFICMLLLVNFNACQSQTIRQNSDLVHRMPAVAGTFYPADSLALLKDLKKMFEEVKVPIFGSVRAIIAPHAGYVYSGRVAAAAYKQLDPSAKYDNVFILATSHTTAFEGAAIYNQGHFITPLGLVEVNIETANKIIKSDVLFSGNAKPHEREHSIEVQLPFLLYALRHRPKIVPIIIGAQMPSTCKKLANSLKPYFNERNLFIISTDFSHYPTDKDAQLVDKITADAICFNKADDLLAGIAANENRKISNLSTSLCGWSAVLTLLHLTQGDKNYKFEQIAYENSSKTSGDVSRVVGYYAIAVSNQQNTSNMTDEFILSDKDKKDLLAIARNTISEYVVSAKLIVLDTNMYSEILKKQCGAFVTLHKNGNLRGCIGRFLPDESLYKVVQDMAVAAATKDYRFSKVQKDELSSIEIEISVLSPLKKISKADEITIGKHGVYLKKGYATGTLLPQVATERGWDKETFLGYCARDKAGIGWDGWKDKATEIYVYEANVFDEKQMGLIK